MKLLNGNPAKLSIRDEHIIKVMHALGDKTRFKMFKIMLSGKHMCVSEIAEELDMTVPAISQHFRIFEYVGLVEKERNGQRICYYLRNDDPVIREIKKLT